MTSSIFENNLQSLSKYNPLVIPEIVNLDEEEIRDIVVDKVNHTIKFKKDSRLYSLFSKYDPQLEAEVMVDKINFNKDNLIIVFGIGLGEHLFRLKDLISEDSRVVIVEHNRHLLNYAVHNVDFSDIFNSPQFYLVYGEDELKELLIVNCLSNNFYNLSLNIETVSLLNYHVYEKENVAVVRNISKRLTSTLYSFGNALDDILTGFQNNYLNIDANISSNSIKELKDKYKGLPAVIVASGPSLDKNIHFLEQAKGKALIIACDASLEACISNGVTPDAIASIERDEPTYTYYYKDKVIDKDIVLVGPGLLWPKIFEEYQGNKIIMSKMDGGVEGWWHNHFDNIEHVNIGQSSATVAFAVAKEAGCNPIILIGQDLAFSEGRKHSDLTHTEHEGDNDDREFDGTYVEDYEGNILRSDKVYLLFKTWYEYQILAHSELEVIDATEGGAYIRGTKVMDFKDAIDQYCKDEVKVGLKDFLQEVHVTDEFVLNKYETVIGSINKELHLLENIFETSKKHFETLMKIEKKYNFDQCSRADLIDILEQMKAGDQVVNGILYEQEVLQTFYKQIVVQTIIFVKQLGNEMNAANIRRNVELQKNLMYMIHESTRIIIEEFKNARNYIENKRKVKEQGDVYEYQ